MNLSNRVIRQITLLSLLMVTAPMVAFPEQFGTDLGKASFLGACFELVFYCVVLFAFHRTQNLARLVGAGFLCYLYRLSLGVMLGLFISVMYSMNLSVSLTLSIFGYLPGVVLHILTTPFILKSAFGEEAPGGRRMTQDSTASTLPASGTTQFVATRENRPNQISAYKAKERVKPATSEFKSSRSKFSESDSKRISGFDQAVSHIASESSVLLAVLVDREGLCLAQTGRGDFIAEDYAPFAREIFEQVQSPLDRCQVGRPLRMELYQAEHKVFLARSEHFDLMVLAERLSDDLLGIRVGQGLEIAKKYFADRYGDKSPVKPEKAYV